MTSAATHSGSAWSCQGCTTAGSARGRQRGHRQPEPGQLLPVELGALLLAAPDDGLAAAVDRVGHRHPAVERDTRERPGKRERHAVERVVVVVADDHEPRPAAARARAGSTWPRLA